MGSTPTTWQRLREVFRPYRWWLVLAFGCVVLGAGSALAVPWLSGELVDTALSGTSDGLTLDQLAVLLLVLFVVQAVAAGIRGWALAHAGQHSVRDLRVALFRQVISLPVPYFDRTHSGEITSRLQSDAGAVYGSGAGTGPQAAYSLLTVIGGTGLLFWISPTLGLLILVVLPIAAVLAVVSGRRTRMLSREYQDQQALTNTFTADTVAGIRVVKAFGAEREVGRRYQDLSQRGVDLGMERARVRSIWGTATALLAAAAIVAAVWLGGRQIQAGTLTAGELLAFIWYGLVVTRGITDLSGQYGRMQQVLGSADRVVGLLSEPGEQPTPEVTAPPVVLPGGTALELSRVSLTYPSRAEPALQEVSFRVRAGESVALVGPSGAGKSSVARLFLRMYEASAGEVRVSGVEVREQSLARLRSTVTLVPQDPHLLAGTVADNLRLGRPDASRADLERAAATAHALDFITALPDGFDTVIGERGVTLSGGQQQRLSLARALVLDPAILLLDEATSALDAAGEAAVRAAITDAMRGRTSLIIAHRLTTVRACDRVIVMAGGRILEEGSPTDLLERGGWFAEAAALHR